MRRRRHIALLGVALLALAACDDLPFASDDDAPSDEAVQIATAELHACARMSDGDVHCWGDNAGGRLGRGDDVPYLEPVRVRLPGQASFLDVDWRGGCAIVARGLYCWGADEFTEDTIRPVTRVAAGHEWRRVSTPSSRWARQRCAIDTRARAFCWGDNYIGQLGDGTREDRTEPVAVAGDHRWRSVSAGDGITCGVTEDDRGFCWGGNGAGSLGIGVVDANADQAFRTTPHELAGDHRWIEIAAGYGGACGVTREAATYCWGYAPQSESLPDAPRHTPFPVGMAGTSLAIGQQHVCTANDTGVIACWGENDAGQLGTGSFNPAQSPVLVSSADGYEEVSAAGSTTCALTRDGDVDCWGANGHLQLADGTAIDRPSPVRIQLR